MSSASFIAVDGTGATVEPHTAIFPILKEVGPGQTRLVGTGFFITMLGHFVTAKHVIQDVIHQTTGAQTGYLHALHFVESSQVLVRHITRVCFHNDSDVAIGKMDYVSPQKSGAESPCPSG